MRRTMPRGASVSVFTDGCLLRRGKGGNRRRRQGDGAAAHTGRSVGAAHLHAERSPASAQLAAQHLAVAPPGETPRVTPHERTVAQCRILRRDRLPSEGRASVRGRRLDVQPSMSATLTPRILVLPRKDGAPPKHAASPSGARPNCARTSAPSLEISLKKENPSATSPGPSMSMSQRSIAVSTTRRPYDSTPFRTHARSTLRSRSLACP